MFRLDEWQEQFQKSFRNMAKQDAAPAAALLSCSDGVAIAVLMSNALDASISSAFAEFAPPSTAFVLERHPIEELSNQGARTISQALEALAQREQPPRDQGIKDFTAKNKP